jgi:homoserine dehydrogenase
MILSGLVFGRQLRREQVAVRGITAITGREIAEARSAGAVSSTSRRSASPGQREAA